MIYVKLLYYSALFLYNIYNLQNLYSFFDFCSKKGFQVLSPGQDRVVLVKINFENRLKQKVFNYGS